MAFSFSIPPHTQYDYFGIFTAALNKAVREDIINKPSKPASNRSYLTMPEVRALAAVTP